jgi:Rrf2 family protein
MRISTKGRYSLEALLYIALLPQGEYASTRVISEHTGVSDGYLEQLFIPLKKAGIIKATRGPLGGYTTGRSASKITVGDILRAVEGPLAPVDCLDSQSCPSQAYCKSRHTWSELYKEITKCVNSISLSDLVKLYNLSDETEYII